MKNKKIIGIILFCLFGIFLFITPVKADTKYTVLEPRDVADTYISNGAKDTNFGLNDTWVISSPYTKYNFTIVFFKFNLTNPPEDVVKTEIKLNINDRLNNSLRAMVLPYSPEYYQWNETGLTWNTSPSLPIYEHNLLDFEYKEKYGSYALYLDVTFHISGPYLCFILWIDSGNQTIIGYTKEYENPILHPMVCWTIEEEEISEIITIFKDIPWYDLAILCGVFMLTGYLIGKYWDNIYDSVVNYKEKRKEIKKIKERHYHDRAPPE